jgi:beta-lactamase regulating signal transducer with metallopeptidase domain
MLNLYICSNLLLGVAAAGVAAVRWARRKQLLKPSYRHHLRVAYALTLTALLLPLATLPFESGVFEADSPGFAQIWSGASMREAASAQPEQRLAVTLAESEWSLSLDAARFIAALVAAGALLFLLRLVQDARRVRAIIAATDCIARRGGLRVLAGEDVQVPFAFWVPGRHYIVVPVSLLALQPEDLRLAIQHEGQHHRQLDTKLVYVYQLLRALCWLNPSVHWLQRQVAELQEFACDEALIQQRRISVRGYCAGLLRLAETAVARRQAALCVSMLGSRPQSTLRGRIEALLAAPTTRARSFGTVACSVMLMAIMAGTVVTASAAVQDRRISLAQAQAMVDTARTGSEFPIIVNARVLAQLNRLLGTPDGRAFVRAGLERMEQYRTLITTKTAQYGLPQELLAVPLAESGFRNLPRSKNARHGAGIWMFIEPTARRFGLTVNETVDQRLDVAAETDAAMRMLTALKQQFGDWGLALLAYNAGSGTVQRGIEETGVRDVWHIIEQGYQNDPDYLAYLMAMLLILRNPEAAQ